MSAGVLGLACEAIFTERNRNYHEARSLGAASAENSSVSCI